MNTESWEPREPRHPLRPGEVFHPNPDGWYVAVTGVICDAGKYLPVGLYMRFFPDGTVVFSERSGRASSGAPGGTELEQDPAIVMPALAGGQFGGGWAGGNRGRGSYTGDSFVLDSDIPHVHPQEHWQVLEIGATTFRASCSDCRYQSTLTETFQFHPAG